MAYATNKQIVACAAIVASSKTGTSYIKQHVHCAMKSGLAYEKQPALIKVAFDMKSCTCFENIPNVN